MEVVYGNLEGGRNEIDLREGGRKERELMDRGGKIDEFMKDEEERMETDILEGGGKVGTNVPDVGRKVALVTGGTGMVGSAVVLRMMCALGSDWTVYVTSREDERGREGMKKIALKYMMGMERSGSPPQMKVWGKE